jgi:GNAT acetyltransferase-like protein
MSPSSLVARSRALWESLAGAPVQFAPALRVAVSPDSRLGPPGWVDIVVISDAVIATAPTPEAARAVQEALGALPAAALTDRAILSTRLQLVEVLGPASLAYLNPAEFQPYHGPVAVGQLPPHDEDLGHLITASSAEDVEESDITKITSPAFVTREHRTITSVAGYRDWPGEVSHVSVLTMANARGRGLARVTASAAVSHAIHGGKLAQWRARPEASQRVARALGFRDLGSQVCVRVRTGRSG